MRDLQHKTRIAADVITMGPSPQILHRIADADCPGVIWDRQMPSGFHDWIDALPAERLPSQRSTLELGAVRGAVVETCDACGMPDGAERNWLVDDIARLAEVLVSITQQPLVRLRLDRVTTDACRKFHIDALTTRLICTYRGAATQFGTTANGDDPSDVFSARTGAPIMLRGTLWPEVPSSGLRHRSPPIEGTGETRLVLVLDPIADT
jgi:hypothetical protein